MLTNTYATKQFPRFPKAILNRLDDIKCDYSLMGNKSKYAYMTIVEITISRKDQCRKATSVQKNESKGAHIFDPLHYTHTECCCSNKQIPKGIHHRLKQYM